MTKIKVDPFMTNESGNFKASNLRHIDIDKFEMYINNSVYEITDGPWEFCKYLIIDNIFDVKSKVVPITESNYQFIRSTYVARNEKELPVLSRWLELPSCFEIPISKYLICVLYSSEQLKKELEKQDPNASFYFTDDIEYGIVAVLTSDYLTTDPMDPITQMRNELGMEHGGNGQKINKEEYLKACDFWDKHIIVK